MRKIQDLVRPSILSLQPYSSARDEFEGTGEVYLDANENPNETGLNRYPDPHQRKIKQQLATIKEVPTDQIFLGNGSDEAIDLIIRIFCEPGKDNIIISDPTYGMYQVSAAINNVGIIKVALTENFELESSDMLNVANKHSKVAFICSPNNPSGNALNIDEIIQVISKFPGIVVIDEAYIDFSSQPSLISQLENYSNLIILQTFSKAWGLAGLRLGMAFSSTEIIELMNKIKPPYNINILTQEEARRALSVSRKVDHEVLDILREREKLKAELSQLKWVEKIFPSDSNFLLVRFTNAPAVFEYLIKKEIIVRDRTRIKHGHGCLRVTVGTSEENKTLLKALNEYQP